MNHIQDLVEQASNHVKTHYTVGRHHVATALKTRSNVYLALHMDTKGYDICAEPIAISNALSANDSDFEYIVAVVLNEDGTTEVIGPCGNCRQILIEYAPKINVIIDCQGTLTTISPQELLPHPY